MSWYATLQPNGKMAIYSSVVDDWIALDLSLEETIAMIDPPADQLERIKAVAKGFLPAVGYRTWHDCMVNALRCNGDQTPTIRQALVLTPPAQRAGILAEVAALNAEDDDRAA